MYTDTTTPGDVRLVGVSGQTRGTAGRVEVFYDNRWHTVSTFNPYSRSYTPSNRVVAGLVCKQLGFPDLIYWGFARDLG